MAACLARNRLRPCHRLGDMVFEWNIHGCLPYQYHDGVGGWHLDNVPLNDTKADRAMNKRQNDSVHARPTYSADGKKSWLAT